MDAAAFQSIAEPRVRPAEAPVVRYVNELLADAIRLDASDIHIEPYERHTRIRFRIDGVLHTMRRPFGAGEHWGERVVSRIKIMSRLDIVERRLPQDGHAKLALPGQGETDFRVSTLPALYGEKVVLRILGRNQGLLDVAALGLEEPQVGVYLEGIRKPSGLVLIAGPTGSGKTTSLYTAINVLNDPARNISSVEDPVEINLDGVNQVNINERTGLDFATVLRAFLRQDPDIIMVGEIRDPETVDIALKAAQTGHLVLSTLHTRDAPAALTRLLNLGARPFDLASSLSLVMAQRLVRKLCRHCRQPQTLDARAARAAGFDKDATCEEMTIYAAHGCSHCMNGYKGCVGIFQLMPCGAEIEAAITRGRARADIERLARASGMRGLRTAGLAKVRDGVTSLAEVLRVTTE